MGAACFYVPSINPIPETPDTPPALVGTDRDGAVDLSVPGSERFEVEVILDVNDPERIRYAFLVEIRGIGLVPVTSGELDVRETQSFTGVTEYESPLLELQRCQAPLDGQQATVQVSLVLTDEVPEAQQREGFTEWTVQNTWHLDVTGQCPEGT